MVAPKHCGLGTAGAEWLCQKATGSGHEDAWHGAQGALFAMAGAGAAQHGRVGRHAELLGRLDGGVYRLGVVDAAA